MSNIGLPTNNRTLFLFKLILVVKLLDTSPNLLQLDENENVDNECLATFFDQPYCLTLGRQCKILRTWHYELKIS